MRSIWLSSLALLLLVAVPAASAGPDRRAERSVLRALAKKQLRGEPKVRCVRRDDVRFSCRWRAKRRLSPHRARVCRGRHRVRLRGRRVRVRQAGGMRCVLRVQAVDPELGFNDNAIRAGQVSAEEDARLTENVGAGIHRVAFDWRYVEPERDRYIWRDYDRIYAAMLERGIRPLFVLIYAPDWARDLLSFCGVDCRVPPARERLPEWREIAGLVAARYPRLAGIEIWNEPNETDFWEPSPDVARYTELLVEAHDAVKRANPAMSVVSGGVSNRAVSVNSRIAMVEFLEGIYANGGSGHFDVLGFHLYPGSLAFEEFDRTLGEVRGVLSRHGDSTTPLWVTETGFSTTASNERLRVSEGEQATGVVEVYRRLKAQSDVEATLFNFLIESDVEGGPGEKGFGLLRPDLSPKPAYCALAMEVRALETCP